MNTTWISYVTTSQILGSTGAANISPRWCVDDGGGGGVLDVSLVGEVRRGPSYPDPV